MLKQQLASHELWKTNNALIWALKTWNTLIVSIFCCLNFQCIALAMIGGSIFILVEKAFISVIVNNLLMTVSVWLIIAACGLVILSVPFCGCIGAVKESKGLLMAVSIHLIHARHYWDRFDLDMALQI